MADNPSHSRQFRLLQAARIAVLVQALALLALVALALPDYVDHLLHPLTCTPGQWCLDFRGLPFELGAMFAGPPAILLLAACWLWRRPRLWPAAMVVLVDVAAIAFEVAYPLTFTPYLVVQALLLLLPAIVSLSLVVALLRRWPWRRATPV